MPRRQLAGLHHGPERGGRVEGRDARPAGPAPLRQRALRRELQLDGAGQVRLLEHAVLADVAGDHLGDLAALEKQAEPGADDARVVGHGGQAAQARGGGDGVDERVGHAAEAEAAAEEGGVGAHVGDGGLGRGQALVDAAEGRGRGEGARGLQGCVSW